MRGDDLTSLFTVGTPDVGFHQGLVLTWDAGTGANTIQVAGAVLGNVPILNTGEAIALKAGHVVGLLRFHSTWFILGRITIPGQSDFAAASVAFDTVGVSSSTFTLDTTQTDRLSSSAINVPAWADEILVHVTAQCSALNNTGGAAILNLRAGIQGIYGAQHYNLSTGANVTTHVSASGICVCSNPGPNLTVQAQAWTGAGAWTGSRQLSIDAIAIFRSVT